ncbi:uncharacterized protein MELLADRAFT_110975 [Melampsora larici-populina 98AG31]|uniref:DUF6589 domain-containing protein n=1 Tax=Melampsora larici-populina (strain 98AG31 / pathotype 3-4-7) TaxID=747676 RepID=F4S1M2_MELLP|nr:uncharacterized protein MELLADRAFT_110975 [Melampsora larici-populina 98AG31]EGG01482.1 hypothetical protein MELLADRAFT_110975 [Melampsora larici-populina 98AG31]
MSFKSASKAAKTKSIPVTVQNTILICDYINNLGMSPKEFMVTFLSSTEEEMVSRRRLSKVGLGGRQTRSIFKNLGRLTTPSNAGRDLWYKLILEEASQIVIEQEVTRGEFPAGGYVSSSAITPDFFSVAAEQRRNELVRSGMHFLHTLIHRKIAHSLPKKSTNPKEDDVDMWPSQPSPTAALSEERSTGESRIDGAMDEATVMSMENLVYVKTTPRSQAVHRLEKVPTAVCAMIAVTCNRHSNAIPVANGLMAVAGGVSCRVHEWLHALGLMSSRSVILLAIDHFRILQEKRMIDLFKINHKLMPFLFQPALLAECSKEEVGLPVFLEAMAAADRAPVHIDLFAPAPAESKHWQLVIKSQLAKALIDYIDHIPGAPDATHLPPLSLKPPSIDQIPMHTPNIHFLRMMDAPDSSADGVSRVIEQILGQIGMDAEAYAEHLLVAGGDVGSNQLVESLRMKRFPPIESVKGYESILSIFGGAHTTWNFAKALWTLHWGHSDKSEDTGVWRTAFALGLEYKKPAGSQDFNTIMRSIHIVHNANLVFVLRMPRTDINVLLNVLLTFREVIKRLDGIDLTNPADCDKGRGTDIDRLTYTLSNNIQMLRRLMQLILSEAGRKIIYQANLNGITPASMETFLTYAAESLRADVAARPPPQVANIWRKGVRNMVKLILADRAAGRSSRFRWGSADVLSSWVNEESPIVD